MKFTVDESTGKAVTAYLRSVGHDVLFVAEDMPEADDIPILSRTFSEGRILITNDKDFGELIYRLHQAHRGVLLLRLHDDSAASRVHVIATVLEQYSDRLEDHFVVVTEGGVRIRPPQDPS